MSIHYAKVSVDDCSFTMINNNYKIIYPDIYPNNYKLNGDWVYTWYYCNKNKQLKL